MASCRSQHGHRKPDRARHSRTPHLHTKPLRGTHRRFGASTIRWRWPQLLQPRRAVRTQVVAEGHEDMQTACPSTSPLLAARLYLLAPAADAIAGPAETALLVSGRAGAISIADMSSLAGIGGLALAADDGMACLGGKPPVVRETEAANPRAGSCYSRLLLPACSWWFPFSRNQQMLMPRSRFGSESDVRSGNASR